VRHSLWVPAWLAGMLVIGVLGRYGSQDKDTGAYLLAKQILPGWIDLIVVVAFSLAIFHWAISLRLPPAETTEEIGKDAFQLAQV